MKNNEVFFMRIWTGVSWFITGWCYVKLAGIFRPEMSEEYKSRPFYLILFYFVSVCMIICGISFIFEKLQVFSKTIFVMTGIHALIALYALIDYFKGDGLCVIVVMLFFISAAFLYTGKLAKKLAKKKTISESWFMPLVIYLAGIIIVYVFGNTRVAAFPIVVLAYICMIGFLFSITGVTLFIIESPNILGGKMNLYVESDKIEMQELFDKMDSDKNKDRSHLRL